MTAEPSSGRPFKTTGDPYVGELLARLKSWGEALSGSEGRLRLVPAESLLGKYILSGSEVPAEVRTWLFEQLWDIRELIHGYNEGHDGRRARDFSVAEWQEFRAWAGMA